MICTQKRKTPPRIVEVEDMDLDFGLEDRPADPYLEL